MSSTRARRDTSAASKSALSASSILFRFPDAWLDSADSGSRTVAVDEVEMLLPLPSSLIGLTAVLDPEEAERLNTVGVTTDR